jgi:hypothetical protein
MGNCIVSEKTSASSTGVKSRFLKNSIDVFQKIEEILNRIKLYISQLQIFEQNLSLKIPEKVACNKNIARRYLFQAKIFRAHIDIAQTSLDYIEEKLKNRSSETTYNVDDVLEVENRLKRDLSVEFWENNFNEEAKQEELDRWAVLYLRKNDLDWHDFNRQVDKELAVMVRHLGEIVDLSSPDTTYISETSFVI